jgi:hypothetical protein
MRTIFVACIGVCVSVWFPRQDCRLLGTCTCYSHRRVVVVLVEMELLSSLKESVCISPEHLSVVCIIASSFSRIGKGETSLQSSSLSDFPVNI